MKLDPPDRSWLFLAIILIASVFLSDIADAQPRFYGTNLVVVRIGDGIQKLSNTGNPFFFDQFTTNGAFVSTVAVPDTGAGPAVLSGATTNDSYLTRSADGRFLTVAMFATNSQTGRNITANGGAPRGVLTVDTFGTLQQPAVVTTDFTSAWRCAVTDGTNNYWGVGANGGVVYLGVASSKAIIENSKVNCRVIQILNGSLYMSSLSTGGDGFTGVYRFNGTPKTSTPLPGPIIFTNNFDQNSKGIGDFAVNPSGSIIYFTDQRLPFDSLLGGIQRWDYDTAHAVWINTYHLTNGLPGVGLQNLTVDWTGPSPVLYTTSIPLPVTNRNSIFKITDTGVNSQFTALVTSGINQVYRGIRFGPVLAAPVITQQPQNQYTIVGGTANFSVVATGVPPLTYQWRFNNTNIANATGTSLVIPNAQLTNAGAYQVVVSTVNGSNTTSQTATLTIETNEPIVTSITDNILATIGNTVAFSVAASSSGPVVYQWSFGNALINNATNSTLTLAGVQPGDTGNYYVEIRNRFGSTISPPAALTLFTAPQDAVANGGTPVTMSTQIIGPAQPIFQWRFNGQNIPQATDSAYTINNPQTSDAGLYSVVASLPGYSVFSSNALLQVIANPISNPPGSMLAPAGLIDWWPMDGNFTDVVGTNHAAPVAGVSFADGEVGLGSFFDAATNTHLQVGATPIPPPWTASFWIYRLNTTWNSASVLGDTNTSLKLEQFKTSRLVGFTDFHVADFHFNYSCPAGLWTHLVWVSTTTNTSLYANGVLQGTLTNTINLPRGQIGADFGGKIDHTLGTIDEVMLFNRALSPSQIAAIFNAGSSGVLRAPDFSATHFDGNHSLLGTVRGLTGKTITLYGSFDLKNWDRLISVTNTFGLFFFADSAPDAYPTRFYKAEQQ